MKSLLLPSVILLLFIVSAFTVIHEADWQMTEEYSIRFSGKKANGFFHKLKGEIRFDENKLSNSSVKLEVDVKSISLNNSLKTWHAKKAKWFNVKAYPVIRFVSSKFEKAPKGYLVSGKLSMKGTEKDITVPFSFVKNVFFGSFKVRRSDFKVGKVKGLSKAVADSIQIDFTIPVKK
ncbi:MAG TPA: YceI family protein [Bacteroidia bacterium]|nr:YceI family protein [Bacteroidia bacterium]